MLREMLLGTRQVQETVWTVILQSIDAPSAQIEKIVSGFVEEGDCLVDVSNLTEPEFKEMEFKRGMRNKFKRVCAQLSNEASLGKTLFSSLLDFVCFVPFSDHILNV